MIDPAQIQFKEEPAEGGDRLLQARLVLRDQCLLTRAFLEMSPPPREVIRDRMRYAIWLECYGEIHRAVMELNRAASLADIARRDPDIAEALRKLLSLVQYPT